MRIFKLFSIALIGLAACARSGQPNNGTGSVGPTAYGTINGGGGVGIRCPGKPLEMLDVFEARQAGLTPLPAPKTQEEAIELVANKFSDHFWNVETIPRSEQRKLLASEIVAPIFEGRPFKNAATDGYENVRFVESLSLSNDFGKYKIPDDCHLEQIAYFSDSAVGLSIVKSKMKELDWLSQSILVGHELAYWMDRGEGLAKLRGAKVAYTSEDSRQFIGRMFTVESLPAKDADMPTMDLYRCASTNRGQTDATYTYAFTKLGGSTVSLVSNAILGKSSFYQMRMDFKTATLQQLVDVENGEIQERAALELTGLGRSSGFSVMIRKVKGKSPELVVIDTSAGRQRSVHSPQTLICEKYR